MRWLSRCPPTVRSISCRRLRATGSCPHTGVAYMYALAARRASCTSFRRFACTCSLLWCCLAVSPSPPSLSATTSSSLVSAARVRPSAALPSTHTLGSIRKLLGGALPLVRRRRLLHRQRPSEHQYDLILESISLQPEYSPVTWTGVAINGVINFVIPLLLYICAENNAGTPPASSMTAYQLTARFSGAQLGNRCHHQ